MPDPQNGIAEDRAERRRISRELRFADLVAFLLVFVTGFQAFAAWRIYLITDQMLRVSDRPYVGVQHLSLDLEDPRNPKVVIEFRNYGQIAAEDAVLERSLSVDGKPTGTGQHEKIRLGVLNPQVPHLAYTMLPPADTNAILEGKSPLVAIVRFSYTDAIGASFCYGMRFRYDHYLKAFQVAGGSARCEETELP
ncbi:MAG: hypothetical protein ABSD31_00180 [Candidatus Binataceae bacterium]